MLQIVLSDIFKQIAFVKASCKPRNFCLKLTCPLSVVFDYFIPLRSHQIDANRYSN